MLMHCLLRQFEVNWVQISVCLIIVFRGAGYDLQNHAWLNFSMALVTMHYRLMRVGINDTQ